ncbi:valine-tRNA ligase [Companilactobacillus farciminis]|nr:valine-tRNA ligase [Companilactobacillus farciminis]
MPHNGKSIMQAKYPENHSEFDDSDAMDQMDVLIELIKSLRKIRLEANAPMSKAVDILIKPQDDKVKDVVLNNKEYIDRFMHPKDLKVATDIKAPALAMTAVTNGAELYVPLAELINIDDEIARQNEEVAKLDKEIERINKKLSNKNFVEKAPEKVVAEQKEKLADYQSRQAKVQQRIQQLQANK